MYSPSEKLKSYLHDFNHPAGMHLNRDNRWVRMADGIPWRYFESKYAPLFFNGSRKTSGLFRMALGALLIQDYLKCTDPELIMQISENPYMQYFIGLQGFQEKEPFAQEDLSAFREKIGPEILAEAKDYMTGKMKKEDAPDIGPEAARIRKHAAEKIPVFNGKYSFHDDMRGNTEALKLLKKNFAAILEFELLYKLIISVVSLTALRGLFLFSVRLSGNTYFSSDMVKSYLTSRFSAVFIVLILIGLAWISLFDVTSVVQCLMASRENRRLKLSEMIRAGVRTSGRILYPRNWSMVVFILLILPLTGLSGMIGLVTDYNVPPFIMSYIEANKLLFLLFVAAMVTLFLMACNWIFSIHAFLFECPTFDQAKKRSSSLLQGRRMRTFKSILLWIFLVLCGTLLFYVAVDGIVFLVIRISVPADGRFYAALTAISISNRVIDFLVAVVDVPLIFAKITALYEEYSLGSGMAENPDSEDEKYRKQLLEVQIFLEEERSEKDFSLRGKNVSSLLPAKISMAVYAAIIIFAIITSFMNDFGAVKNHYFRGTDVRLTGVAAHRGDSMSAPENSIPAFENAIKDHADWIELDVHETLDGVIVVSHDADIRRIANVNRNIPDLTYEELKQYDVGSWFSPAFKDLHIATLDEVIKLAKGKIKLNIEIKPAAGDHELIEKIIKIIRDNDFQNDCVLASLNKDMLVRVKELDPEIRTLYNMAFATGDMEEADFADEFSLEESTVTQDVVDKIHNAGSKIWVWTVNDEDDVRRFREMKVDYVLTDDPTMARAAILSSNLNDETSVLISMFFQRPKSTVKPDEGL